MKLKKIIFPKIVLMIAGLYAACTFMQNPIYAQEDHAHDHEEERDVHDGHDEDEHENEKEHAVTLTLEDRQDFGIKTAMAGKGTIFLEAILPGEVQLNRDTVAHVSPRYSGVVQQIHARLGDNVKEGQVLAKLESNETLVPFELKAPIGGTIVEFHITLGESIDAGEYLYIIADLSTVWADLNIYQRDLPIISNGQQVAIAAGHNVEIAEGVITYTGPVVSEETRTGLARVVLANPDGRWKPGMFITGRVAIDHHETQIAVPLTAIQQKDEETVVFVEDEHGRFAPQPVRLGQRDSKNVEILTGLESSQVYVVEGGFFLKAELEKDSFGEGHDH